MNKEKILEKMIEFEIELGEDFFDQGFFLHPLTFMSWCLGKGHLTQEKYGLWNEDYRNNPNSSAHDPQDFVYNWEKDYVDAPYAIVVEEDYTDEGRVKAYSVVAEFISEIELYKDRFYEFLKNHGIEFDED